MDALNETMAAFAAIVFSCELMWNGDGVARKRFRFGATMCPRLAPRNRTIQLFDLAQVQPGLMLIYDTYQIIQVMMLSPNRIGTLLDKLYANR
jgi:hypothetical protein